MTAIRDLGKQLRFTVQVTDDPQKFDAEHLAQYRAVVFLNTSGDVLTDDQQAAFEEYYHAGGGFVGVGSAVETELDWPFFTEVLGTRATSQTDVQPGTIKVADRVHDASKDLPEYWTRSDAWYNFESNVRGESHVLATVVELVDDLGSFAAAALGRQPHRHHRRHDGPRPPGLLVQGLAGWQVVLHRARQHGGELR